jgi:hypothetical protein
LTLAFELVAPEVARYPNLPFEVTVDAGGEPSTVLVTHAGQVSPVVVRVDLSRGMQEIRLASSAAFRPSDTRANDFRLLSVIVRNVLLLAKDGAVRPDGVRFGTGFHADEGGGTRWMESRGEILVGASAHPRVLGFDMITDSSRCYRQLPFDVELAVGQEKGKVTVDGGMQKHSIRLELEPSAADVTLRLRSDAWFVPAHIGKSADLRQLSVRVANLHIEPVTARALT